MPDELSYRTISLRTKDGKPSTFDRETRSVEVVLATETPVPSWGEMEVLLIAGARIPKDKKIPMLDTHNRFSIDGVLGSIRKLHRSNDDELVGTAVFSKRMKAEDAMTLVEEGHVSDVSIGYRVNKVVRVGKDETQKIKGKDFEGPVSVVVDWTPKEGSLAPIGADETAKIRSQGGKEMPEKDKVETQTKAGGQDLIIAERGRVMEIQAMCERLGCPQLSQRMIAEGTSLDDARERVMSWQMAQEEPTVRAGIPTEPGETVEEKRINAQIGGLMLRAGGIPEKDLPPGSREYATSTLIDLAKECCRASGIRVQNLSPTKIYERALTTADFPYILGTSQERLLQQGYEEAGTTWEIWAKPRPVENFRTQKRPQLSEFDNLDEVPEHGDYKYGDLSEAQEEYSIATYGKLLALTRQMIVNDDLNAFGRIARGHGAAAARKVNDVVYSILTANAAMSDGTALFHANHGNLGTGGVPSSTTIKEMLKMVRTQTGPKGAVLGIVPRYIIAPAAIEVDVLETIRSISLDSANPAIINVFYQMLEPVIEPILDSDSATAWYGVAGNIETVEVGFLGGVQGPYLESRTGWSIDGVEYKVRIDVGAKCLDFRGMFRNAGA